MSFDISQHARKRIKERMGIHGKAQLRMINKVVNRGLTHAEMVGQLHNWVAITLVQKSPRNTEGYIYDNVLFLVRYEIVITVIPVPSSLQKLVKISLDKRKERK